MARGLLRNGAVVSAVVLVTAAGSLLSGCREDPAGLRAINNASSRLGSVTGGAEVAVDSKFQSAAYADVLKMLAEAKVDAADPMAGAAGVITASAHLGSAGPAADAAVSSMRTVSSLRSELRSARSQWVTLSAVAQAAAFDSGPVIAELDKQLSTAKGELAEAQGRLDKLQADQDKMRGDAKAKADQANTFELESVKLREQTRAMSATNAQPVLAKALEAKAKCDELRLQSSNIEAEAMLLEPRKLEINQRRQELDIGIKSLETERARAQKRGTDAADIEKQAKDKAAGAAKSVESLVKQLDEERAKLLPEFDRVIDACRKAASASASKTPGRDAGGTALTARAQQRLGELLLVRAAESQAHAEQMSGLANATPALAGKSSYADAAKAATEAAKTAREEAKEALEKARTSYKALKPTGDAAKATRDEIVKYLTKVGGLTPEETDAAAETPAAAPADGEKPAEDAKPEKAAATGDEADVRTALGEMKAIWSEEAKQVEWMDFTGAKVLTKDVATRGGEITDRLNALTKEKFGKSFDEYQEENRTGDRSTELDLDKVDPATVDVKIEGDTATVTSGSKKTVLKKVDGKWLLHAATREQALFAALPGGEKFAPAIVDAMIQGYTEVEASVRDGSLTSNEQIDEALKAKMTEAAKKLFTPPGGGGGNGG